jgi:PiT family inorganic phosphate transporter
VRVIDTENPFDNAKRYVPFYMFLVGFVISLVTIFKGLKHVGLHFVQGPEMTHSYSINILSLQLTLLIEKMLPFINDLF